MLPSIFGENLFDEFFGNAFDNDFWSTQNPLYGKRAKNLMKTDVKEEEDAYSIAIDLPGFDKDNVQAHLEDGYLTVTANKSSEQDEKDQKGRKAEKDPEAEGFSAAAENAAEHFAKERWHAPRNPFRSRK